MRAHHGQAGRVKSSLYLSTAARIVTIEARHAAAAALLNQSPYVDSGATTVTPKGAFDSPSDMDSVLKVVKKTNLIRAGNRRACRAARHAARIPGAESTLGKNVASHRIGATSRGMWGEEIPPIEQWKVAS